MVEKINERTGEKWEIVVFDKKTKLKNYFISNFGRIKSVSKNSGKEMLIKTNVTKKGFVHASIKLKGAHSGIYPHRKVAEYFLDSPSEEHTNVIHKDMNRQNNKYTNLAWVTDEEQAKYVAKRAKAFGYDKRTHTYGVGNYKLTAADVAIIKKQLLSGKTRRRIIAKRFNVSTTQLKRIERGENWGHVKPAE